MGSPEAMASLTTKPHCCGTGVDESLGKVRNKLEDDHNQQLRENELERSNPVSKLAAPRLPEEVRPQQSRVEALTTDPIDKEAIGSH